MKKSFVAALLLTGAAAMFATSAFAQLDESSQQDLGNKLLNAREAGEKLNSRARRLVTSGLADDTVYVGHSYTDNTGFPGPIVNYWNVYTGKYSPGVNDPANAIWDWDHGTGFGAYVGDSLAGWWPYRRAYGLTGGLVFTDNNRPWWAIDIGNSGNYRINQPGSERTKGVTGYWHDDAGAGQGSAVTWSPISGSRSAWCGLRQHGDNSAVDLVTGNPYNQTVLEFQNEGDGGTGTNKHFPGYTNQMDQMLYRDIPATSGNALTISFNFRTHMSNGLSTTAGTRSGWFDKDPLAVTAGNFISASVAGVNAPIDSFMVYIGSPVNDAAARYSDGTIAPVYDPQRRWFSEVLRVNEGVEFRQLMSIPGTSNATTIGYPDTLGGEADTSFVVPIAIVNSILGTSGNPGRVRLVFRVKTNQIFSDSDSRGNNFTSRGHGAAVIDDVTYQIAANPVVTIGDFETPQQGGTNSIDNRTGATTTTNWKSTGKPPAIYFHTRALGDLEYADLCGPPNSPARFCNIGGVVMTAGNRDDNERHGDSRYLSDKEVQHGMMSPTINLVAGVTPNNQGLTADIVDVSDDIYIFYDMYAGMLNLSFTGNAWTFGGQSFPAAQALTLPLVGNGARVWGAPRVPGFQIFNPEPQCFTDLEPLFAFGLISTSNGSGVPDSLRVLLGMNQQCFRFAVSLACNSDDGAYFDNVSVAFVDNPSSQTSAANAITLGPISASIWNLYNDAFPANDTNGLPGTAAFDTLGAWLQTGLNNYPNTGNVARNDIPGDSMVVTAGNATVTAPDNANYARVRVDLVFRILPGPGNYEDFAGRSLIAPGYNNMKLLNNPQVQDFVVGGVNRVVPGVFPDPAGGARNFFASFAARPGDFSKGRGAPDNAHFNNTRWDHLTWNSARCDTLELNRFPATGGGVGSGLTAGQYASMYHEAEYLTGWTPPVVGSEAIPAVYRPEVGINKNMCFLINPAVNNITHTNIQCTVPAWALVAGTGYDVASGGVTREFTKIIPDGLLTAGSHVQYFFRKSHAFDPLLSIAMLPDTTLIDPQNSEGSRDGHRWQQFGILPDRWKDPAFNGGPAMACLLYVDNNDRRGNERVWVSVMDSIGGTSIDDRGNHNGWGGLVASSEMFGLTIADPDIAASIVSNKNVGAGTTWDMYGVKASESLTTQAGALGSRLALPAAIGFAAGKDSRQGPTPEMLRRYYRLVALLSGDLTSGVLGPFANRSQNDIAILDNFLLDPSGSAQPRGILVSGDGFVQSETQTGQNVQSHLDFMADRLGVTLESGSYQEVSGNLNDCADLLTTLPITTNPEIYGVSNTCLWSNDLLLPIGGLSTAAAFYENVGVNGPYEAAIYKPATAGNWVSLTEGWEIEHAFSRYCENTNGRLAYYYKMLGNVFGSICVVRGAPEVTLDTPNNGRGADFVNFMKIGNNVLRAGTAKVSFGLAKGDLVSIGVYDVTGRKVRTLANRQFAAGEHSLQWDGSDDDGSQVARGVYFARIQMAGQAKDMNGRVIVLR